MIKWLGSWTGVTVAAGLTTVAATIVAQTIAYLLYPDYALGIVMRLTPIITTITAFPFGVFIWSQVKKNIELSAELRRLVNRDRLTDVSTRDHFFERMDDNPKAVGVALMVDIDHFKGVNDGYGHFFGDEVIINVARTLSEAVRSDDLVCRFGGEEFMIFLFTRSADEGLEVAERMRRRIEEQTITFQEQTLLVTVSIGGAVKKAAEHISQSIQRADSALYQAKACGRNLVVMDHQMPKAA
jgi:diguanylate cyclase (GGDEF)-like protein